ncbi:MAG: MoaD/ThiS family protein [Thermodesulfobacteriota bacterium]|jgi:molybdopterin converting factor small subunit|nr:MAG: MoaD/ThiS family protein [Thermodesulfobacteriota bacterium]
MKVKLFASLREGRFKEKEWEYVKGITVSHILGKLNINKVEVGALLVNSLHVGPDYTLQEDDILAVFPVLGGG